MRVEIATPLLLERFYWLTQRGQAKDRRENLADDRSVAGVDVGLHREFGVQQWDAKR